MPNDEIFLLFFNKPAEKIFLTSNGFSFVTVIIFVLEANHGEEKTHKTSSILPE